MKPPIFDYYAPDTLDEALTLLAEHGEEAKPLAGGQSLVPAMNFRLAQPAILVDLNRISTLFSIREGNNRTRRWLRPSTRRARQTSQLRHPCRRREPFTRSRPPRTRSRSDSLLWSRNGYHYDPCSTRQRLRRVALISLIRLQSKRMKLKRRK